MRMRFGIWALLGLLFGGISKSTNFVLRLTERANVFDSFLIKDAQEDMHTTRLKQ